MKNVILMFILFLTIPVLAQEKGQLNSNFNFSLNYEKNYDFKFPVLDGANYFEANNATLGYSKVNENNKVFTYLLSYTYDHVDYLDLNSIALQAKFGTNVFNWKVFYFNLYIDFNLGYDRVKIIDTHNYFSFGGGGTAELDIKISDKIVIAPTISHLINVYNIDFVRIYFQSGITLKYNL